jgi:hypothetical protein
MQHVYTSDELTVYCDKCDKQIPYSAIETRFNFPNKGDMTHWHHDMKTDTAHHV